MYKDIQKIEFLKINKYYLNTKLVVKYNFVNKI